MKIKRSPYGNKKDFDLHLLILSYNFTSDIINIKVQSMTIHVQEYANCATKTKTMMMLSMTMKYDTYKYRRY